MGATSNESAGLSHEGTLRLGRATFAVALAFLVNGMMFGAWAARIPGLKDHAGLDSTHLGFALLCGSGGAVMAMSVAGLIAARRGSHLVTVAGLLGCAAALPFLALADSFVALAVALLVLGGFQGSMDVAMNASGLAVEQARRRPILSRLHGTWSVGSFLGAFVTAAAIGAGVGMLEEFALVAGAMVLSTLALWAFMIRHRVVSAGPAFRRPSARLLALGVAIFCGMLAEGSANDWSGVFMRTAVGSSQQEAAITLAVFSGSMAVSRLAGDRITELVGGPRLVAVGAALGAVGLAAALTLQAVGPAIGGFMLLGLGLGAVVPVALRAGGSQPGISPGVGIAAVSTMGYAGLLSGPPIIGTAAGFVGIRAALALVVALLVFLAAAAPRVMAMPATTGPAGPVAKPMTPEPTPR